MVSAVHDLFPRCKMLTVSNLLLLGKILSKWDL